MILVAGSKTLSIASQNLEECIEENVQIILTEGDRLYLQGLSRTDLVDALENELRFLGLYAHSDTETPAAIHALVDQRIDQWRRDYFE